MNTTASNRATLPTGPTRLRTLAYRHLTHLNFRRREECLTLVDWLAPQPSDRILDIGCGDGWWDHRIAQSGAEVVGIDIFDERLEEARVRNALPNTRYLHMDATSLAFEDASFDKAVSMCVIEHFHDEDAVLSEIHRVLVPGAPFIVSADSLSNPELSAKERAVHRERYAVNTFYTDESLREKLDAHGFDVDESHYILTTPVTLAIARLSWHVDDLEQARRPLARGLGEAAFWVISTAGRAASALSERIGRRPDSGLTLLARARRR